MCENVENKVEIKLDINKIKNKKKRNDGEPLCEQWVRVSLQITYKQSLSYSKPKYLQNKLGNKPANETMD